MRVAPGCLLEWSDQIKPLDREGPRDGDCLQGLCWKVSLPSVKLASFAGSDHPRGVFYSSWPIKTLSEDVADEASGCRVVSAGTTLDFLQQFFSPVGGDAELKDSRVSFFVELTVDDGEGFGPACDASSLCSVGWQLLTNQAI